MKFEMWEDGDGAFKHKIQLDSFDTWSADYTIALMVYPLLTQLKEKKQGAPGVNDEDVPVALFALRH